MLSDMLCKKIMHALVEISRVRKKLFDNTSLIAILLQQTIVINSIP